MNNVLSITLWLPIAAAMLLVVFPKNAAGAIKGVGLLASLATFIASLGIVNGFHEGVAGLQLVEAYRLLAATLRAYGMTESEMRQLMTGTAKEMVK